MTLTRRGWWSQWEMQGDLCIKRRKLIRELANKASQQKGRNNNPSPVHSKLMVLMIMSCVETHSFLFFTILVSFWPNICTAVVNKHFYKKIRVLTIQTTWVCLLNSTNKKNHQYTMEWQDLYRVAIIYNSQCTL